MLSTCRQFAVAILILPLLMAAAPVTPATLDKQLEQCLETNDSMIGMSECYGKMTKAWDGQINQYYQLLGGDKNAELRNSQMAWIKFRDLEFAWLTKKYDRAMKEAGGGSMWGLLITKEKMNFQRTRALELYQHHQLLTCGMACDEE